jgi:hypothetical protein
MCSVFLLLWSLHVRLPEFFSCCNLWFTHPCCHVFSETGPCVFPVKFWSLDLNSSSKSPASHTQRLHLQNQILLSCFKLENMSLNMVIISKLVNTQGFCWTCWRMTHFSVHLPGKATPFMSFLFLQYFVYILLTCCTKYNFWAGKVATKYSFF